MKTRRGTVISWSLSALLAAAISVLPNTSDAQSWGGVLDATQVVPANESTARGSVALTLSGETLIVMMNWSDLIRFPGGAALHVGPKRTTAIYFPQFPATQGGSYSHRIELSERLAYTKEFLDEHGGRVADAHAALLLALDAGETFVDMTSQRASYYPEIGGRVTPRTERP